MSNIHIKDDDYTDEALKEFFKEDLGMTKELANEILDKEDVFKILITAGFDEISMSEEDYNRCIGVIREMAGGKSDVDTAYERAMSVL